MVLGNCMQHEFAWPQAEAARDRAARSLAAREQLRIGEPALPVHDGDLVRPAARAAREHLADGQAFPQARSHGSGCDVLRPADKTFTSLRSRVSRSG